jgi:hypothetical protein
MTEKKDVFVEMHKVANLTKGKTQKDGTFPPFVICYSLETGNNFVQMPEWKSKEEREKILTDIVKYLKDQHPYGFILASPVTRYKFKTPEDYKADVNAEEVSGILIVAKTPEKSFHISTEYENKDGKFIFKDELVDVTNDNEECCLDEVFKGMN